MSAADVDVQLLDLPTWIARSRAEQGLPLEPTAEEIARVVVVVNPGGAAP